MNLQTYIAEILTFLNDSVLPFLLGIAFLIFVWNVVRYFILNISEAGNKEKGVAGGPATARQYALWSIIAFVVIIAFWGIINMLITAAGFGGNVDPITPDYMLERQAPTGPQIDNTCIVNPETCGPNANSV